MSTPSATVTTTPAPLTNEQKLAELRTRRALLAQSTEALVVKESSGLKSLANKIQRSDEAYTLAIAASDKVMGVIDMKAAAQRLAEQAQRAEARISTKAAEGKPAAAAKAAA